MLLLARQPAELGVTAGLGAAALDQREHLEDAVVHGPGQPGPLPGDRRLALGQVPRHRTALQQVDEVADDEAADDQQEDVAVVGLGELLAGEDVGRTSTTAATAPPTSRQWMAQASSAPITQKPATVALKPSPLTHGVSEIISTAMARSSPRSSGARRRDDRRTPRSRRRSRPP